jgi:hypothetical protein
MARRILRWAAEDTWRIEWTRHVLKRMRERRISPTQVLRCLRNGRIVRGPYRDDRGGWLCELEGMSAGVPLRVVVAVEPPSGVIVIAAFEAE